MNEATIEKITSSGAEVVFNTTVPPGVTPFLEQLYNFGFTKRGGHLVCTYFDENFLNLVPAEHVEGLYGCLDYYRDVHDPFSIDLLNRYAGGVVSNRWVALVLTLLLSGTALFVFLISAYHRLPRTAATRSA